MLRHAQKSYNILSTQKPGARSMRISRLFRPMLAGAAVLACLGSGSTPAKADILGYAAHPLPINTVLGLLPIYENQPYLTFQTKRAKQRVKVTFSSNCMTDGWLYLRTFIDNTLTKTDNNIWSLYCRTGDNFLPVESMVTKVQVLEVPKAGTHTLTIDAQFDGSWYQLYAVNVVVEN